MEEKKDRLKILLMGQGLQCRRAMRGLKGQKEGDETEEEEVEQERREELAEGKIEEKPFKTPREEF